MKYYYGKINTSGLIEYDMNIIDIEGTPSLQNKIVSVPPLYDAPVTNATQVSEGIIGVDGTTSIPTGFSPDLDTYQIEETISGLFQDFSDDLVNNTAPIEVKSDEISIFTSSTNNDFNLAITTIGTSDLYPRINTHMISAATTGEEYIIDFDVVVKSGTCKLRQIYLGSALTTNEILTTRHYSYIITPTNAATAFRLYFDGTSLFDIEIKNWTGRKLTSTTQRTQTRVLQHHPVYGDRYYIDGIRQDYATLPAPAVDMNLNNIAKIGYPDIVDQRIAKFKVYSEIDTTAPKPLVLPSTPEDLTVEYYSDTRVLVSWTYPVAGTYPIADTWVIQDGVEFSSRDQDSLHTLADANIAMDYSVYAVDTRGNVSPTSDIVTYTNVVEGGDYGEDLLQTGAVATLGNETLVLNGTGFDATADGTSGTEARPRLLWDSLTNGTVYRLDLNTTITSGSCTDFQVYDGSGYVYGGAGNEEPPIEGDWFIEFTCNGNSFITYSGLETWELGVVGTLREVLSNAPEVPSHPGTSEEIHTPRGSGTVKYLDVNAPDDTGDGSELNPYQNIDLTIGTGSTASSRLVRGDVLVIREGTYYPANRLYAGPGGVGDQRLTYDEGIVIQNYPDEAVWISGGGGTPENPWGGWSEPTNDQYQEGVLNMSSYRHYDVFDGIGVMDSMKAGIYIGYFVSETTVQNCNTYHTGASGVYITAVSNFLIDNNNVELATYLGDQEMITAYACSYGVISNNHIFNGGNENAHINGLGIDVKNGGNNIDIHHNLVHDIQSHCIYVDSIGNSHNLNFYNNVCYNTDANGIQIATEVWDVGDDIAHDINIYNNICHDLDSHGIRVGYSSRDYNYFYNINIVNNVCYNIGYTGILYFFDSDANATANNIVIANNISRKSGQRTATFYDIQAESGSNPVVVVTTDTNNVERELGDIGVNYQLDDPLFVDPDNADLTLKDFSLQTGSPSINTGNSSYFTPTIDANDNPRPVGIVDIGAYEDQTPVGNPNPELVTNGDFSNGTTGWTISGAWTLEDEAIRVTNAQLTTQFFQTGVATGIDNETTTIEFEILEYTQGTIYIEYNSGGGVGTTPVSGVGVHSEDISVPSGTSGSIIFRANSFTGLIDNVSVKLKA